MDRLRLLGPRRVSRFGDGSTSLDTQDAIIEPYAAAHQHTIIPVTPDLSVSGAVPIRERPGIGPWLADDRLGEWDGVITAKLDRLFRSQADFVLFYRDYCEAHSKVIISAGEGIDTSTEIGVFIANILVMFAEMERGRMRVRRRDAAARLREATRWNGGKVLYPYEAYKDGSAWYLRPHPERAETVRYWAAGIIGGRSAASLTIEMNRRGILSAMGKQWADGTILLMLRNPMLRGYIQHYPPRQKGQPKPAPEIVLGSDGMPLRREAILNDETWLQLQAALDRNGAHLTGNRRNASRLLQVAFCALCKRPLYADWYTRGEQTWHTYRCPGRTESKTGPGNTCKARSIPAGWLEPLADYLFLSLVGDLRIPERNAVPEDHSQELAAVDESMKRLETGYASGRIYQGADGFSRFAAMMTSLEQRRDRLNEHQAARAAAPRWREGKRYFRDEWESRDEQGRRALMMQAGFRVNVAATARGREISYAFDDELAERAGRAASGLPVTLPDERPGMSFYDFYDMNGNPRITTAGALGLAEED